MSKMWKSSRVPPPASWLMIAALAGCAGPTDSEGEQRDEQDTLAPGALPLDPLVTAGSAAAADAVGPATRDGTGQEDETRDIEGLAFGGVTGTLSWVGMHSGTFYGNLTGGSVVIDGVQVRSGSYIYGIRFHYYLTSHPDNLYTGGRHYWTSWYGPNRGTEQPVFWCPDTTGLIGYIAHPVTGARLNGISFFCNFVGQDRGGFGPQDFSPYWGASNGGPNPGGAVRDCGNDLLTNFNLRADSSSVTGIEGICQAKW
jgi:hypothetical protein